MIVMSMAPLFSKLSTFLSDDAAFHVTRLSLDRKKPSALHAQDYYELFWLDRGSARLHTQTARKDLIEGDLIIVPPNCIHGIQGLGEDSLLVTLLFPATLVSDIIKRHPASGSVFEQQAPAPIIENWGAQGVAGLSKSALKLEHGTDDSLALEAFLLPLIARIVARRRDTPSGAPRWLSNAVAAAKASAVFRDGAAGLVAQTGRAHAHVSRSMKQFYGMTPSEFVNAQRMQYAARALSTTNDPLHEIAQAVGLANMSHFHRLFRGQFGMTPHRYRKKFQKNAIYPNS